MYDDDVGEPSNEVGSCCRRKRGREAVAGAARADHAGGRSAAQLDAERGVVSGEFQNGNLPFCPSATTAKAHQRLGISVND